MAHPTKPFGRLYRLAICVLLVLATYSPQWSVDGAITSCVKGTVVEGSYCMCQADSTLVSYTPVNGVLTCSDAAFVTGSPSCPAAIIPSAVDVADNVTITDVSINEQGTSMVVSLEQPRVVGRRITGISLGACMYSVDHAGPSSGTGALTMLPANKTSCMQQFFAEFNWITCMENANSMTRTTSEDGRYFYYTGYMEINITTPLDVNIYLQANQTQTLARALKFAVPRTITVDMTQSSISIWNRMLVLPNITFVSASWGSSATGVSTVTLASRIINPWTLYNSPAIKPEITMDQVSETNPISTALSPNVVCDGPYARGVECNQTLTFQLAHNGHCTLSGTYMFQNVPMDCQNQMTADCPADFLTNFAVNLRSPIFCSAKTETITASNGRPVTIYSSSPAGNLGTSAQTLTFSGQLPANGGNKFTGVVEVVRFMKECTAMPYMKVTQYIQNLQIAADGLSATFDIQLNNDIKCNMTSYTTFTVNTAWNITSTNSGRRSEPHRRDTGTVTTSMTYSIGSGGPDVSFIFGQSNTPIETAAAITGIVARAGNESSTDIEITTQTMGPYMYDTASSFAPAITTVYSPMPLPGAITVTGECTGNETCYQKLSFKINHAGACVLDGDYTVQQYPVVCQPNLPGGIDCANTTVSFTVNLVGVNVCNISTLTVDNIWDISMQGQNGRKAMVYGDTFPITVTIDKLMKFGQDIDMLVISKVERTVPESANPGIKSECTQTSVVTDKAQLDFTRPTVPTDQVLATVNMLMDEAVVCQPPQRGYRTQVQLTFTYTIGIHFLSDANRRRRRMIEVRQTTGGDQQQTPPGPQTTNPLAVDFDVVATPEELGASGGVVPSAAARVSVPVVAALVAAAALALLSL